MREGRQKCSLVPITAFVAARSGSWQALMRDSSMALCLFRRVKRTSGVDLRYKSPVRKINLDTIAQT
jgi:hypothetical protein